MHEQQENFYKDTAHYNFFLLYVVQPRHYILEEPIYHIFEMSK